jgi:hypothetical protein
MTDHLSVCGSLTAVRRRMKNKSYQGPGSGVVGSRIEEIQGCDPIWLEEEVVGRSLEELVEFGDESNTPI